MNYRFKQCYSKSFLLFTQKMIKKSHSNESVQSFYKLGILKNFAKFTRKYQCWSLFFNKFLGLQLATLLNKRLQHRCFPVSFPKLLIIMFLTKHSDQLQPQFNPRSTPTQPQFNRRRACFFFHSRQNFIDPRHPHQNLDPRHFFDPSQHFMDLHHPRRPRQNLTHANHEPTHPSYPRHPCTHAAHPTHTIQQTRVKMII